MKVGIVGASSTVARKFIALCGRETYSGRFDTIALDLDRYLICTGYLAGKALHEITEHELERTWMLNYVEPARFCDMLFSVNPRARVCLIGSESGYSGSYDMAYAGAKAALHLYVETKRLEHPEQSLVAIAPHIIWDSAMTQRRGSIDLEQLEVQGHETRLGRWLTAEEVALQALSVLTGSPALSGTIVRMRAK